VSPPPPRAPSPTPRPKGSSPFRVDLGASLRVGFGIVPKVSVGPMLDARVGGQTFALLVDAGADLPTGSATNSQVSPGTVSGALLWGGVGFCETPFLFFVCGRLDAGALEGTGSGLSEHRTATSFYAGASLLGGITYELRPNLTAGINAELLAPFTRTSLSLDGSSVWTEPSLAATVGLGAGYRY
jgi:hypothetical protein